MIVIWQGFRTIYRRLACNVGRTRAIAIIGTVVAAGLAVVATTPRTMLPMTLLLVDWFVILLVPPGPAGRRSRLVLGAIGGLLLVWAMVLIAGR